MNRMTIVKISDWFRAICFGEAKSRPKMYPKVCLFAMSNIGTILKQEITRLVWVMASSSVGRATVP